MNDFVIEVDGRIVNVQPRQFHYEHLYYNRNQVSYYKEREHEFIYIAVEGRYGEVHELVYPYSKQILERDAKIKYRPISNGKITAREFLHLFVSGNAEIPNDFEIETEGIIVKGGITYR